MVNGRATDILTAKIGVPRELITGTGVETAPAGIAAVLGTIDANKKLRQQRAQEHLQGLLNTGLNINQIMNHPKMRQVYLEAVGQPTTVPEGPRRGILGVLPPKRRALTEEEVAEVPLPRAHKPIAEAFETVPEYMYPVKGFTLPQLSQQVTGPLAGLMGPQVDIAKARVNEYKARGDKLRAGVKGKSDVVIRQEAIEEARKQTEDDISLMFDPTRREATIQRLADNLFKYAKTGVWPEDISNIDNLLRQEGIIK